VSSDARGDAQAPRQRRRGLSPFGLANRQAGPRVIQCGLAAARFFVIHTRETPKFRAKRCLSSSARSLL
jgi:hypothetical protein